MKSLPRELNSSRVKNSVTDVVHRFVADKRDFYFRLKFAKKRDRLIYRYKYVLQPRENELRQLRYIYRESGVLEFTDSSIILMLYKAYILYSLLKHVSKISSFANKDLSFS